KGTVSDSETVTKKGLGESTKCDPRESQKRDSQIPFEVISGSNGYASPSPHKCEASASPEKERGIQGEPPGEPSRITEAEREAHVTAIERRLGRRFGSKR